MLGPLCGTCVAHLDSTGGQIQMNAFTPFKVLTLASLIVYSSHGFGQVMTDPKADADARMATHSAR